MKKILTKFNLFFLAITLSFTFFISSSIADSKLPTLSAKQIAEEASLRLHSIDTSVME